MVPRGRPLSYTTLFRSIVDVRRVEVAGRIRAGSAVSNPARLGRIAADIAADHPPVIHAEHRHTYLLRLADNPRHRKRARHAPARIHRLDRVVALADTVR